MMKHFMFCAFLALGATACERWSHDPSQVPFFTSEPGENARVIYVDPLGNDARSGDIDTPVATLGAALQKVMAGRETVIRMAPGVYRERVQITAGMAMATIEGARNGRGDWLTIIDGSQELDPRQWKARPEVGPGVFAYPLPDARLVLVDHRSVARLDQRALVRRLESKDLRPKTISEVLRWPENQQVTYRGRDLSFWETIGGVFTPSTSGDELWLRLRNGVSPAKHKVAVAFDGATVELRETRSVTLRNLLIRGGRHGVDILGGERNLIEHCYIPHGRRRINLEGGASDTAIVGNRLEMGFYGEPTGAWGISESVEDALTRDEVAQKGFIYHFFKYWAGPTQISDDISISVEGRGETLIRDNLLDGGLIGISLRSNARVERNVVRRMSSVGTGARREAERVIYDGNLFSDCNLNLRIQSLNEGTTPRRIDILRNVSLLPRDRGTHLFCHYGPTTERTADHEIAVYQNTFLGGVRALALPPAEKPEQALRNFKVLNNRFIGCELLISARRPILSQSEMFGLFDYNQIAVSKITPHLPAIWLGTHNLIEEGNAGWNWDDLSYTAPSHDNGRERGIDLSRPYEIGGKTYPALMGLHSSYFAGERPDLGAPESDVSDLFSQ